VIKQQILTYFSIFFDKNHPPDAIPEKRVHPTVRTVRKRTPPPSRRTGKEFET
jgi:hypothetical protein